MNEKELRLELTAMQKELNEANEKVEELEKAMHEAYNRIDILLQEIQRIYRIIKTVEDDIFDIELLKKDD